jgi:hypothetical protein
MLADYSVSVHVVLSAGICRCARDVVFGSTTSNTPLYHPDSPPNADTSPNIFGGAALRDACKSFLDSIIVELCFPHAPYPQPILFEIPHDAIDESPAEAKRFPQALWDAVGDLSVHARSVLSLPHLVFS